MKEPKTKERRYAARLALKGYVYLPSVQVSPEIVAAMEKIQTAKGVSKSGAIRLALLDYAARLVNEGALGKPGATLGATSNRKKQKP